jgi:hypothetical protein
MGILFFGAMSVAPGRTVADECVVNLNRGKHNCADISEIEIKELVEGRRGTGQAVVKVTLDGAVNPTGYTEATFRVKYSTIAEGWTVNIGDSESNNGYRGDAAHQSNDAEMQILRSSLESPNALTVYGNDYRPEEELNPLLQYTLKGDRPNITLTVKNQFFGWERRGNIGKMKSEFLYALDGQLDDEGPENYDVYAAFNRTIGNASRDGKGVGKVIIELKRDPDTPVLPSVPTVTSLTGRVWMDRNLGASRVATTIDDEEAFGDYYQWGRGADGHEASDSPVSYVLSTTDQPLHNKFIGNGYPPHDWRTPSNDNLWQGVYGVNNPCPPTFRIPTTEEFDAELNEYGRSALALFESPLKMVLQGYRGNAGNSFHHVAEEGAYWTSNTTPASNGILWTGHLNITPTWAFNPVMAFRTHGLAVRCIQALPEEL